MCVVILIYCDFGVYLPRAEGLDCELSASESQRFQ